MKTKKKIIMLLAVVVLMFAFPATASAKTGFVRSGSTIKYYNKYGNLVKKSWFKVNGKTYYAFKTGTIATGLKSIGGELYYFSSTGVNRTGWYTINGRRYYFMKKTREAIRGQKHKFTSGRTYYFNEKGQRESGFITIGGSTYYFNPDMKTGWVTLEGKKYYLIKSSAMRGQRASGFFSISGKIYYFDKKTGVLRTNTTFTVNGNQYVSDASGVVTSKSDNTGAPSKDMLFFLTFESGSDAYNQTGGDNGNACGAYQFDYRYSLLSLVKYAYKQNPVMCKEFKKYAAYKSGTALHSNSAFYKAWKAIYKRDPIGFARIQDTFARDNYYTPVEKTLMNSGYDIVSRPDVVKGAVYSYSIQHGQTAAVNAVKAVKLKSSMSDKTFLKKLYEYRIKKFPAYKTRYNAEYKLALTKL